MRLVAIGGSDAGIGAALRARELDPTAEVTVVLADAYPNFSICGIPYYISAEVGHWRDLAHRSLVDLEATGMTLRLDTRVRRVDADGHRVLLSTRDGREASLDYDALVIGTGALPVRPPIRGLGRLGADDGTTAHKQGRIAGENALGGTREFAGSLGTQVVKVFDMVAARTGVRDHEATAAGFDPLTVASQADDHKSYYPGSHTLTMRYTGDRHTGRLPGVQLVGHLGAEVAKRIDIPATAILNEMTIDAISDLDLSYTPPLGSPWDALQIGAHGWTRQASRSRQNGT